MAARNASLDVLRGLAVLLVILFHLDAPFFNRGGWIGVDLFFVLSGFLISGLLFHDFQRFGQLRIRQFLLRRAFKILPSLYFFLAVSGGLMLALHIFAGKVFVSAVFFYSNYLPNPNSDGSLIGHTWSLAIEEHFYLTLPVLLVLLIAYRKSRDPFAGIPYIFTILAIACFTFRWRDPYHYAFTHMRADALFTGVTLRFIERFRLQLFTKLASPFCLALGLTFWILPFTTRGGPVLRSFTFSWTSLSVAFLIAWLFSHDATIVWTFAPLKALARIGRSSYSIYLWQQPICLLMKHISPGWFFKTVGFVFSLLVGIIMSHAIEFPALHLRDKIWSIDANANLQPAYSSAALPIQIGT